MTDLPPPSDGMGGSPEEQKMRDVQENKDIAAFGYLWVMAVVVYMLRGSKSPFVKFHSKQAIVLFIVSIPVWFIPLGIGRVLELVVLAGMLVGFMNAAQGQWRDVPLAGPLSRGEMTIRQAWQHIVGLAATVGKAVGDLVKKKTPPSSGSTADQPAPGGDLKTAVVPAQGYAEPGDNSANSTELPNP